MIPSFPPPISHWSKIEYIRTPVFIDDNNYIVSVGDNEIRIFTEDDVPDFIKSLITMIHAFTPNLFNYLDGTNVYRPDSPKYYVSTHSIYDNNQDKRLDEIGWQLTLCLYMLVLTPDQFSRIKNGNTRKQN
jgi:hypothetical protein